MRWETELRCVTLVVVLAVGGGVAAFGCGGSEGVGRGDLSEKSAAQRFCDAVSDYASGCGPRSPCDDALSADCSEVAGVLADSYLRAAAGCIEEGAQPVGCLASSLGAIEPSAAHREFASAFCSDCAMGIPGCEDLVFGGGEGDVQAVGKLLLPLGDSLVHEVIESCMGGLTCLPKFPSCVQGVLAKRAIPDQTLACLIDPPEASAEPVEACPEDGEASAGSGSSGTSGTSTSSGATGSATSGGDAGLHQCTAESSADACFDCCMEVEQEAYGSLVVYMLNECSCSIGSPCNGLCPDLCNGGTEYSTECIDCVNAESASEDSACIAAAVQGCKGDAACTPLVECAVDCNSAYP